MKNHTKFSFSILILVFSFLTLPFFQKNILHTPYPIPNTPYSIPHTQLIASEPQNFSTTLHTTYTVNINGTTHVEHKFKIKNLTPTHLITKYGIQLSSKNVDDINIMSNGEKLPAEIVNTKNQTSIGITFPDKLVGEGKERIFSINYNNHDIAQVSGKVLEVTIPQLADSSVYNDYQVTLITPSKFGKPNRITPDKYTFKETSSHVTINFFQPSGRGISAIFGNSQIFDMKLSYYLENTNNQPVITQISLPPDTPYQRLNYQKLDPKPTEMKIDLDGNWIATYLLPSNSTTKVEANVLAQLTLDPNGTFPSYGTTPKHIQPQEYWETQNQEIMNLSNKYKSPREIYDFTTQNLTYTTANIADNLERLGAQESLNNPDLATCQEFTDLFITLARANQIPARRITGYAYTRDSVLRPLSLVDDILHAWPEYYSEEKKSWVAIDPTWGNTTQGVDYFNQFDLNHIVFAINGISSTLPHPAGAYKIAELPTKNVEVSFGESYEEELPSFEVNLIPKHILFFDIPGMYDLEISNQTGSARYKVDLDLTAEQSELHLRSKSTQIEYFLPYQTIKMPLTVYNTKGVLSKSDQVTINLHLKNENVGSFTLENVTNITKISQNLSNPYVLIGVGITSVIITLGAGSLLIFRRK